MKIWETGAPMPGKLLEKLTVVWLLPWEGSSFMWAGADRIPYKPYL